MTSISILLALSQRSRASSTSSSASRLSRKSGGSKSSVVTEGDNDSLAAPEDSVPEPEMPLQGLFQIELASGSEYDDEVFVEQCKENDR